MQVDLAATALNLVKLAVTLIASIGIGAHFRYHAVEYGAARYWVLAPYVGMAGAFLTVAVFVEASGVPLRLAVGGLAAVWYALYDVVTYRGASYAEQREYRLEYGPGDQWVDALFDDDRGVGEVSG